MYYTTTFSSPLGIITLASDGDGLTGLWLEGQKTHNGVRPEERVEKDDLPIFEAAKKWLDRYFVGEKTAFPEWPLRPVGGVFRQTIWRLLCDIPYGELTTYGEIAKKAAVAMNRASMSSQAVGGAVGHNPISIIIPCHRVVGVNGNLTGYAGGLDIKSKLLEREGVDMSRLFWPAKRGARQ